MNEHGVRQLVLIAAGLAAVGVVSLGLTVAASDGSRTVAPAASNSEVPSTTSTVDSATSVLESEPSTTCVPESTTTASMPDSTAPSVSASFDDNDSVDMETPGEMVSPTVPATAMLSTTSDVADDVSTSTNESTTPSSVDDDCSEEQ